MKKIEAKVEATTVAARIAVIGAGIAGLSAAIYARRSGFDVTLIEQHSITGGTCTSWRRKGYLFEGAVHWLTGSSPKTELYQSRLWAILMIFGRRQKTRGGMNRKSKR